MGLELNKKRPIAPEQDDDMEILEKFMKSVEEEVTGDGPEADRSESPDKAPASPEKEKVESAPNSE
jgi:hypothetical protein